MKTSRVLGFVMYGCIVRVTGHEQINPRRSRLSRGELTPFSECGRAVLLEDIAAVEVAVLVEWLWIASAIPEIWLVKLVQMERTTSRPITFWMA